MNTKQKYYIAAGILAGLVLVVGLLYYYQQQGFLKVFPTSQDLADKKILVIDRSKFSKPEGLTDEKFEEAIKKLEQQREKVLGNTSDVAAWFEFGYEKEFLNDHAGAAAAWEKTLQLQPQYFLASINLANTYQYFLKDYAKAEYNYYKTLAIKPDLTAIYDGLHNLYRYNYTAKQDRLEPTMLLAIKNDPQNESNYYAALVEFFAINQDVTKAKTYLQQLQKINPQVAVELTNNYPTLK